MIDGTTLGEVLAGYRRLAGSTDTDPHAPTVQQFAALAADLHDVLAAGGFNPVFVGAVRRSADRRRPLHRLGVAGRR